MTQNTYFLVLPTKPSEYGIFMTQAKKLFCKYTGTIRCISLTSDNKTIISCSRQHNTLWSLEDKTQKGTLQGHTSVVTIIPNNKWQQICDFWFYPFNVIPIWNLQELTQEAILEGHSKCIWTIAMSSDETYLVFGSEEKVLRIWNLIDRKQEGILEGHTDIVTKVVISSDRKHIVSCSLDRTLRISNFQGKS